MLVPGAGRQLPLQLPRLGGRRRLLLPADLVLVRAGRGRRRPARRPSSPTGSATSGFMIGHVPDLRPLRVAQLHRRASARCRRHAGALATVTATGHRPDAVPRGRRQVGPAPAVHLAARRHGGPDAGVGPHPRRHHGHRRRLPDGPGRPDPALRPRRPDGHRHRRARPPPCSPPPSPAPRTTSRRCWPTRPSPSSATCSSAIGSRRLRRPACST